jgi:hypothetical protein
MGLLQLKNFGERYQIETFMGVVLRNVNSSLVFSGGSTAGEQFFDMYPQDQNPLGRFFRLVHGRETIKNITGQGPAPFGNKKPRQPRMGKEDSRANMEYCMGMSIITRLRKMKIL